MGLQPASRAEEPRAAAGIASKLLTRGQFLKGVSGATVAMTVLSGTGKLARPAQAAKITSTVEYTGSELTNLARNRAKSGDLVNIVGQKWSDGMQTGAARKVCITIDGKEECLTVIRHNPNTDGTTRWHSDGSLTIAAGDTVISGAAKHTYSDGNTMTAVSYLRSNGRIMHSSRGCFG